MGELLIEKSFWNMRKHIFFHTYADVDKNTRMSHWVRQSP